MDTRLLDSEHIVNGELESENIATEELDVWPVISDYSRHVVIPPVRTSWQVFC